MTFLRNLGHDLVDKKLWPVAVALVLAVIAVPVLLGGGDAPATPVAAAPVAGPAVAPVGAAEVSVAVDETATLRRRQGKTRDPFKQQYAVKELKDTAAAITGSSGVAPGAGATGTPAATPGDVPATTDTTVTPQTDTTKTFVPKLDPLDVYRVALRFGKPGKRKTIRNVPRLSPLPNSDQPFFVFLGVLSGGKKAVFLVGADAEVTGDGTCRPSRTNCETVEMGRGDTVFLDRKVGDDVIQYELDLLSVARRTGAEAAAANKAATAKTRKEAAAKDQAADDLTDLYRWDADRGVLVRRKLTRKTRSSTAADEAAAASGSTPAEYRAWYLAVYFEYLRQVAAGADKAALDTAATLAAVPHP